MGLATRPRGASLPERIFEMFPVLSRCCIGAAAIFPAVSSSSLPSREPWPWAPGCWSSTSRPKASSRRS